MHAVAVAPVAAHWVALLVDDAVAVAVPIAGRGAAHSECVGGVHMAVVAARAVLSATAAEPLVLTGTGEGGSTTIALLLTRTTATVPVAIHHPFAILADAGFAVQARLAAWDTCTVVPPLAGGRLEAFAFLRPAGVGHCPLAIVARAGRSSGPLTRYTATVWLVPAFGLLVARTLLRWHRKWDGHWAVRGAARVLVVRIFCAERGDRKALLASMAGSSESLAATHRAAARSGASSSFTGERTGATRSCAILRAFEATIVATANLQLSALAKSMTRGHSKPTTQVVGANNSVDEHGEHKGGAGHDA